MSFIELYPIVVAALIWGKTWARKRVLFYCDNGVTVNVILKGRSKVSVMNCLMRKLAICAATNNFVVYSPVCDRHI